MRGVIRAGAAHVLFLALAAVVRAAEAPPPAPHGVLQVPEATWDAGKVVRGTKLSHAFVLKNVGTAELSVDAKPG